MCGKEDLQRTFEMDEWTKLVGGIFKPIRQARYKLSQFKIFHRLYWTQVKLYNAGMSYSNLCWQCKIKPGNITLCVLPAQGNHLIVESHGKAS